MVISILAELTQIKADIAVLLQADTIERICRDLKFTWRDRLLSPVVTVHGFLLQVLPGAGSRSRYLRQRRCSP